MMNKAIFLSEDINILKILDKDYDITKVSNINDFSLYLKDEFFNFAVIDYNFLTKDLLSHYFLRPYTFVVGFKEDLINSNIQVEYFLTKPISENYLLYIINNLSHNFSSNIQEILEQIVLEISKVLHQNTDYSHIYIQCLTELYTAIIQKKKINLMKKLKIFFQINSIDFTMNDCNFAEEISLIRNLKLNYVFILLSLKTQNISIEEKKNTIYVTSDVLNLELLFNKYIYIQNNTILI